MKNLNSILNPSYFLLENFKTSIPFFWKKSLSFIVRYFVDYFVEIIGLCCDKFSVTNLDTLLLDILLLCFLKYVELPKQHSAGKNSHYPFSFKGNGRTSTKIWGNLSVWDTKSHCAFEWSVAKDSGPDTISTFSLNERSQQQQI